jgi:hypothetical protein
LPDAIPYRTPDGDRAVHVAPELRDDLPTEIKEGLSRRRQVTTTGICPCGARFQPPNRATRRDAAKTGKPIHMDIRHENDCPATNENLSAAAAKHGLKMERWTW